jgi:hypothetical protein
MMGLNKILPGTGRGTIRRMVEGAHQAHPPLRQSPCDRHLPVQGRIVESLS